MSVRHTPGPWVVKGISMNDGSISFGSAEMRMVVGYVTNAASLGDFISAGMRGEDFGSPENAHTQWANARLITAAPDMLAALKIVSGLDIFHEALRIVDAAIAKAEGR